MNATAGATARDYFALFQLEPGFSLNEAALETAYHSLLSQFHPDRYAGQSAVEQRMAAQFCADINSGFRVLVNEVTRAEYLLKRAGVDLQSPIVNKRSAVPIDHPLVTTDSPQVPRSHSRATGAMIR